MFSHIHDRPEQESFRRPRQPAVIFGKVPQMLTKNAIAFTGHFFQTGAINNLNVIPCIPDQPSSLEFASGDGYRRSTSAQHGGEELMGKGERGAFGPVSTKQ